MSLELQPQSSSLAAERLMNSLSLIGIGVSLGGFESLAVLVDMARVRSRADWQGLGPVVRLLVRLNNRRTGRPTWTRLRRTAGHQPGRPMTLLSATPPEQRRFERARTLWPGIAVATMAMLSAAFMAENYGGPLLLYAPLIGLDLPGAAGIFLGGTIHDVAQVVGVGAMISQEAVEPAMNQLVSRCCSHGMRFAGC